MTTHTPGPWALTPPTPRGGSVYQQAVSAGRAAIGLIHDNGPEEQANAALIAAAPDLLGACEAVLHAWDRTDDDALDHALTQMAIAIAKAKSRGSHA